MSEQVYVLVAVVIGFVMGGVVIFLFVRNKVDEAANMSVSSRVAEITVLKERIKYSEEQKEGISKRFQELENKFVVEREGSDLAREERASFKEKADRLSEVEIKLSQALEEKDRVRNEMASLKASESGKAQAIQSLEGVVEELKSVLEREKKAKEAALLNEGGLSSDILVLRQSLEYEGEKAKSLERSVEELKGVLEREKKAKEAALLSEGKLNSDILVLKQSLEYERGQAKSLEGSIEELKVVLERERKVKEAALLSEGKLSSDILVLKQSLESEREQTKEKMDILLAAKEELANQFKVVANNIFEEKSRQFAERSKENISIVLSPLKDKLQEFQVKVENIHAQDGRDRATLVEQVKNLSDLNKALSKDAQELTTALKGSNKVQGKWGELILERALESAGLRKDAEYSVQESYSREDNTRARPDVVINLPGDRKIIVDAKVSLTAYENFVSGGSDVYLREHLNSVRKHVNDLSDREYNKSNSSQNLDFTVMFVAVEPAFILAIANDQGLLDAAWQKNILLASPSTILFVLRTVACLWRQEAQTRNIQEVVKCGADLYDKFVGFVDEFQSVGKKLDQAKQEYENAFNKLSRGNGNIVKRVGSLRDMGVSPSKSLNSTLMENSFGD